jgi:hypothetical protein
MPSHALDRSKNSDEQSAYQCDAQRFSEHGESRRKSCSPCACNKGDLPSYGTNLARQHGAPGLRHVAVHDMRMVGKKLQRSANELRWFRLTRRQCFILATGNYAFIV